ncbi:MAG: hypothetical protein WBE76_11055 [Terracidiphilus sp.]
MRLWAGVPLLCAIASGFAFSQTAPAWDIHIVSDPQFGSYTELRLQGAYVKPPNNVAAQPSLVVRCSDGKVLQNYFSFGAVLSVNVGGLHPVRLETTIDNVPTVIRVDDLSIDGTAAYFPRRELNRMLYAKQVTVGAVEFAGPPILAKFAMPDSAPVFAACGEDRFLKHK